MAKRIFIISGLIFFVLALLAAGNIVLIYRDHLRKARQQAAVQARSADVKVTFIEGWTEKDYASQIEKKNLGKAGDFLTAERHWDPSTYSFLSSKPKSASLEGFLFPDTYLFAADSSADDIVKKLLDNFETRLDSLPAASKATGGRYIIPGYENLTIKGQKGMSLYDVLILASIIEKESGRNLGLLNDSQRASLDAERKTIAGIFYNRLQKGIGLESDATLNYITGKNDPSASAADTQIDSPYNTYKYRGLPPGPICNPSLSSIAAVLAPTKTDYYYFLHKTSDGSVVYAKTFDEHIQNKYKYLR